MALGDWTKFSGEALPLVFGNSIRLHVTVDELIHPARRQREGVRTTDFIEELRAHRRLRLTVGVLLEILAHRGLQPIERFVIAHFARKGVVERGQLLSLYILESHADVLALATLRLVRKIIGPPHGPLDGLSGSKLHHELFDAGDSLS